MVIPVMATPLDIYDEFALVEGRGGDILEAVKNLPRGSVEVGRTSLAPPKYA